MHLPQKKKKKCYVTKNYIYKINIQTSTQIYCDNTSWLAVK